MNGRNDCPNPACARTKPRNKAFCLPCRGQGGRMRGQGGRMVAAPMDGAAWWRRRWMARMDHYRCPAGDHWHVGNNRPRKAHRSKGKTRR